MEVGRDFDIESDLVGVANMEGYFTSLNAAWEKLLGWSREELMSRPFIEFVHPDDLERTIEEARKGEDADYQTLEFENRYRCKDGSYRWLRWHSRSDGELWFAIAFDITERKRAEEQLRDALLEERLLAYSQPIVDYATARAVEEELLVRLWANGHVLEPAEFVPAAERFDLIGLIDVWMARQGAVLARAGRSPSVNLSTRSIVDSSLRDEILDIATGVPEGAGHLVFEITESAAADNIEEVHEFAARLAALGCHLSLDDFGTGYGSLTYLRRLPITTLKIDRSFISDLVSSPEDRALVASVISMAKAFRLTTIAEGIEDRVTARALAEFGADLGQGFFYGRPVPLARAPVLSTPEESSGSSDSHASASSAS